MWKRLLAVVLCICLLSVFLFGCGGSTVYKYNSLTISMPDDADSDAGGFGVLGQQLANTLLESLLKDSYIEKKADGSYSFFTTISGQSDVDIDSMLSDEEIRSLPYGAKIITLENALRFLMDYIDGDTYYQIARPEHNLDRARTQCKLVYDMESKFDEMKAICEAYI